MNKYGENGLAARRFEEYERAVAELTRKEVRLQEKNRLPLSPPWKTVTVYRVEVSESPVTTRFIIVGHNGHHHVGVDTKIYIDGKLYVY